MNEFELIEHYFVRPRDQEKLIIGNGDDCAVFQPPDNLAIASTTDTLIAGVHFPDNVSPQDLGHKVLAVNLSDLAAMGAEPRWISLALSLPELDQQWLSGFSQGFFQLADAYGAVLIGGDMTRGPLSITIQALGQLPATQALTRSGARPGDGIYVSGVIGSAGLGLLLHRGELTAQAAVSQQEDLLKSLHRPLPQVELGVQLRGLASAAVDISDGLLADLGHILSCSEVGAKVDLARVPVPGCYEDVKSRLPDPYFAFHCGDDYQLCFTVPQKREKELSEKLRGSQFLGVTRIGEICEAGFHLFWQQRPITEDNLHQGYQHF